jgi:hypothetical protein
VKTPQLGAFPASCVWRSKRSRRGLWEVYDEKAAKNAFRRLLLNTHQLDWRSRCTGDVARALGFEVWTMLRVSQWLRVPGPRLSGESPLRPSDGCCAMRVDGISPASHFARRRGFLAGLRGAFVEA